MPFLSKVLGDPGGRLPSPLGPPLLVAGVLGFPDGFGGGAWGWSA